MLRFRYKNGALNDKEVTLVPGKIYNFGKGAKVKDYKIPFDTVSRSHLNVWYEEELGWVYEDLSSQGTYMHPRTFV